VSNHGRRLKSIGGSPGKDAFNADVEAMNRGLERDKAPALAMVAFAQHLAGTVMPGARHSSAASLPAKEKIARLSAEATPRESRAPSKRLDMHTEATLEQVLAEKWEDGTTQAPNPGPPPRPDPGFEAWDPIIPSYARKPEEEK
jgi:hypothetical protein